MNMFRAACVFIAALAVAGCRTAAPPLRAAAFACDATPPAGHPLCGGWIKPVEVVDDPLLLKGVVLEGGGGRFVLCALDWCRVQTGAHDLLQARIAEAAGVPPSHVALHTVHQHNAPIADRDAQHLLEREKDPPLHLDLRFLDAVADRAAVAVRGAAARMRPFDRVGRGMGRVEGFASNRRSVIVDGRILPRSSASRDPRHREAPEGVIDPWLRTVSLFDGDTPLVRLHYYASHPQSYYGDGRVTSDTAGLARARLEAEEGVPQIYFTGCGGDVAAGKYNDGSPEARARLTDRLYAGMKAAAAATRTEPVSSLAWRTAEVRLPLRAGPVFTEETFRRSIADPSAQVVERLKAALALAWIERVRTRPGVALSALALGPVRILHLPGEAFVEYQIYAQSLRPGLFVAVAAYGECGPGYICTDRALDEGGYEPTMSLVGPPGEAVLKAGIAGLLH